VPKTSSWCCDVGEPVLGGDAGGPPLDRRVGHLDRAAAGAAHQVVVVHRLSSAVGGLALGPAARRPGRRPPVPAAPGRPSPGPRVAALAEQGVQVLGGAEAVLVVEQGQDGAALPGLAARRLGRSGRVTAAHLSADGACSPCSS
jgi:hypothetical protein